MNDLKINLTTDEAAQIVAALGFVRRNLVLDAEKMMWHFVPGQSINYDLAAIIELEDIMCRFSETIEEAIETHPFNPFIKTF